MKSVKFKFLVFCLILGLFGAGGAVATQYQYARLLVNEDAQVNQSQPTKNYGLDPNLLVGDVVGGWHDIGLYRSYLKFDVGSALPAGAVVVNAELLLMLHETYPGLQQRTIESCYVPTDTWTEGGINWSNAPGYNPVTTGSVTSTFNNPNSYYCWNVTPDVITAMGDNGVYSTAMIIKGEPTSFWNNFYSRDWPILPDKRPYLEIVYTVPGKVVSSGSEGYNPQPGSTLIFGPGPPGPGLPPIPANFFFPGSEPFEGVISLGGGGTPMVIERTEGAYIPDGGQEPVPTEIVALSLKSTDPIEVSPPGPDSFFDVYVELEAPSQGAALIDAMGGGGGGGCIYQERELQLRIEFVNTVSGLPASGSPLYATVTMGESSQITWQEEPGKKEAELLGYDGFYASEGQTAHSELLNDMMQPAGGLDYATLQEVPPEFCITTEEQWLEALGTERIRRVTDGEWTEFISQYNQYAPDNDCDPYPETTFIEAELYVCGPEGGGGQYSCECNYPQDAGLVMMWGDETCEDGHDYASAFAYEYPADPDLTGCVLTTTVYPPCGMNVVSIGLQDTNGNIRGWYWNVAAAGAVPPYPVGTIPCSPAPGPGPGAVATNISIDLSKTGVGATTPTAASYSNNPAFDITKVTNAKFDENNTWIAQTQMPAPGSGVVANWNYWKNIVVTKKTPPPPPAKRTKFYIKWSQPPILVDPDADPKLIRGWDERSNYHWRPVVADDWLCEDDRSVTDIHWWGSFLGWNQPYPPPIVPTAFHIGIWYDVPVGADPNYPDIDYSHPAFLIWENYCDNWVWEFYGYDWDPRMGEEDPCAPFEPYETCFQFEQFLNEDEWFKQDPNLPWPWGDDPPDPYPNGTVYWLSISAIYDPNLAHIPHPWGWKTRERHFEDDAVRIWEVEPPNVDWPVGFVAPNWPPSIGYWCKKSDPIWWPTPQDSWDMCFELTTKEPAYEDDPVTGDLNADRIVDLFDVAILAGNWLATSP